MRSIRNCSVAVVGGAGFLGSHAVDHLINDRGCDVLVIDNLVVGRKEFIHKEARFEHHDITSSGDRLKALLKSHNSQFVFNWTAYPYIPTSFARPIHVCDVNFMGALKVINASWEAGAQAVLQVSSAEIYGDTINGKIDENVAVRPHSSYGASKAAVDFWCQSAWKERRTPVITLRQFNCLGERETHPYVVPEIIGQLYAQPGDEPADIRLGNDSRRDFLYAGDAVAMAVELLECGEFGETYNLGSEEAIGIYELAATIARLAGREIRIVPTESRRRPWEIWHLQSDNAKINACITARPKVGLAEALQRTIDYYVQNGCLWGF